VGSAGKGGVMDQKTYSSLDVGVM